MSTLAPPSISIKELSKAVKKGSVEETTIVEAEKDIKKLELDVIEKQQILEMRKDWGRHFKALMWAVFVFEVVATVGVALGIFHFQDEWFLRIIIISGFGQLLTMPYLVAKFLFDNEKSK